jgi:hypothetical protein
VSSHLRIELRSHLDDRVLRQVLELIESATAIEGHRPVGEHKYSHLRVGAEGWVGILAYDADRLVGYAHTRWNPPGAHPRLAVEVVVHPDRYGSDVARTLLLETRGVLAKAGGGAMWLWVHRVEDAADTLAARAGASVQRELAYMTRDLAERPAVPPPPEGVEVRAYRPGADDEALLAVNNAAFEGHPENGGWDLDELAPARARLVRPGRAAARLARGGAPRLPLDEVAQPRLRRGAGARAGRRGLRARRRTRGPGPGPRPPPAARRAGAPARPRLPARDALRRLASEGAVALYRRRASSSSTARSATRSSCRPSSSTCRPSCGGRRSDPRLLRGAARRRALRVELVADAADRADQRARAPGRASPAAAGCGRRRCGCPRSSRSPRPPGAAGRG